MEALQRLVSQQRRVLHSTQIRQRPTVVSNTTTSSSSSSSSNGRVSPRHRKKRKVTTQAVDKKNEKRFSLSFSKHATNFVFDDELEYKTRHIWIKRMNGM